MEDINHLLRPGLLVKKLTGRIRRKTVRYPDTPVVRPVNGAVQFEHKRLPFLTLDNQLAMLTGSYDVTLQDFLRRHLHPGDIFIDGGANVGFVSAIAASHVGHSGEVHGFEPMRECYERLCVLAGLNPQYHFFFNHAALGGENGVLTIASPEEDARNATLVPGKTYKDTREVEVKRLDDYIAANIRTPEKITVIKLDVQGYEYLVLRGLERFLTNTHFRPVIACDMKPWEVSNLGYTLDDFHQLMTGFGYQAYDIVRENVNIDIRTLRDWTAVVFKA